MRYQFHFYPTLLNEFLRYEKKPDDQAFDTLMAKVNKIPETDPELLKKFRKGVQFEEAVVKNKPSEIAEGLIAEARSLLPEHTRTQQFLQFNYKNIRFYGYADVLGDQAVIDLKSTAHYYEGKYAVNFQHLYLYALKDHGFREMKFIVCDFEKIYQEIYAFEDLDFQFYLQKMEQFAQFLALHQSKVTNKKIMVRLENDLFSDLE